MTPEDRRVAFECPRCHRTLVVIYHTADPRPETRDCRCGATMGIVLVGDRIRILVDQPTKKSEA
jgi:hypothetical protein